MRATLLLITLGAIGALVFACTPISGKELFQSEYCPACHIYKGIGKEGALDLSEVTSRRSDEWIRQQLEDSRKHRPDTGMPSFAHLSKKQVEALIRFLHTGE